MNERKSDGAEANERCGVINVERLAVCRLPAGHKPTTRHRDDVLGEWEVAGADIRGRCGAIAAFWPDDEGCEVECELPAGHVPATRHAGNILGEWDEDEVLTWPPSQWRE